MPLNDVVRDVLSQLASQLTYRKIVVEADLADVLPMVRIDPDRFRQVLINILGNAADAMTTGGTLRITTRADADGSTVRLDVCDDGVGIDPVIRDRVFDPFVSTKRDGVGSGLVNEGCDREHGGTIKPFDAEPKAPAPDHDAQPWLTFSSSTTISRLRRFEHFLRFEGHQYASPAMLRMQCA
jgi:two-component system C4-dicarboxylate transport sensor histidine kinase DctB